MPSTGLRGPHSLNTETIDSVVEKNKIGAYALGYVSVGDDFMPKYVGRSDNDLNGRLKTHIGEGCSKFKFEYYSSAKKAFEKECNLHHDWKEQLDNKEHPDRPSGTNWKCPRCNVSK